MTDLYLIHHGIKGQKWGVRRFQNEDGSLTKAGQKRYGSNLDLNDKSRVNIAKIRKGEALRRYDVARSKDNNNYTRIAETRSRVRSANRAVKSAKRYDGGAKLSSKGRTINGESRKGAVALAAAYLGSRAFSTYLSTRLSTLRKEGRYTPQHGRVAANLSEAMGMTLGAAALLYGAKLTSNQSKIRTYQNMNATGQGTIERIGSTEYKDRLNRAK